MTLAAALQGLAAVLFLGFGIGVAAQLVQSLRYGRRRQPGRKRRPKVGSERPQGRPQLWKRPDPIDYPVLLTEVAGRLQSGASVVEAWQASLDRLVGAEADRAETQSLPADGVPEWLAAQPHEAARTAATATRFSFITGAPLKDVLQRTATALTEMERSADAQRIAFTGPKMSARVLTALPVFGLLGGELLGADSISWLLGGGIGSLAAALGVGFAVAGHLVTTRMIARAAQLNRESLIAPAYCDLIISGLRGGSSVPLSLDALGEASGDGEFSRVAAELQLGAPWLEAWQPVPLGGSLLVEGLQPAWEDGVSATRMLSVLADQARARSVTEAQRRAEKLSVKLAFPLATLLLPAFILLGLLPIFVTLLGSQLGTGFSFS